MNQQELKDNQWAVIEPFVLVDAKVSADRVVMDVNLSMLYYG